MKYMGHKGRIIRAVSEAVGSVLSAGSKICDPFCGSGAVSWHLAAEFSNPVWSGDLQQFAVSRAAAVVARRKTPNDNQLSSWVEKAEAAASHMFPKLNGAAIPLPSVWDPDQAVRTVQDHRDTAVKIGRAGGLRIEPVITSAYGGHYFSVSQSVCFDALRSNLPTDRSARLVAISALVGAASCCSASPGHTAQPFQPTVGASKWLLDSWRREPIHYLKKEWEAVVAVEAKAEGKAVRGDALSLVTGLTAGDVVFIDPPYSGVHYSRFYHVLETIARGKQVSVEGRGRYPPASERPVSAFSKRSQAFDAIEQLIRECAQRRLRIVITFPTSTQSNGLSADNIEEVCDRWFNQVARAEVASTFSSLGGNGKSRAARALQTEAIIIAYS